ncbi:TNF receptor-associated factor 2-like [Ornithodoros turicata]|uniref:TNF receptor-associated factor 2-like n=1 Tax=Ornithodoros turicata TaxID=34597 RepID=UPI003138BA94
MSSAKCMSGFSDAVDWRPIEFVNLPSVRSCSLCHVVPRETFILECFHALCNPCYRALLQGSRLCPLDGGPIQKEEVEALTFKPSHLKKQKMRCCNSGHGCEFVGVLDEVTTHFMKHCDFHVVPCNACNTVVLRNDMVRHYSEGRCRAARSSTNDGSQVSNNENIADTERKMNVALDAAMERLCAIETQLSVHTVSIDDAKQRVSANAQALNRLLNMQEETSGAMIHQIEELSKCVDAGKRAVMNIISEGAVTSAESAGSTSSGCNEAENAEEGRSASRAMQNSPDRCGSEATGDANKVQKTLKLVLRSCKRIHAVEEMLRELQIPNRMKNSPAYFHIRDFADIEKESLTKELVTRTSDIFHLSDYSAKLQVEIARQNGVTYLGVFLRICAGSNDSFLKWPFTLPYAVMLVHPTCEKNNIECFMDDFSEYIDELSDCFYKPLESSNTGFGEPELYKLEDVAKDGFVCNNSISVGVRIL